MKKNKLSEDFKRLCEVHDKIVAERKLFWVIQNPMKYKGSSYYTLPELYASFTTEEERQKFLNHFEGRFVVHDGPPDHLEKYKCTNSDYYESIGISPNCESFIPVHQEILNLL
ncbi:MAG: hypothetical protein LBK69_05955 [Syntrophomonadaceae bacterium]|jgi:hypothetical protein|nr:hypothetical protein [Syntrophomonadaceae bacterium]